MRNRPLAHLRLGRRCVDLLLGVSLAVWSLLLAAALLYLGGHRIGVGNFRFAFVMTLLGSAAIVWAIADTIAERATKPATTREIEAHRRTFVPDQLRLTHDA